MTVLCPCPGGLRDDEGERESVNSSALSWSGVASFPLERIGWVEGKAGIKRVMDGIVWRTDMYRGAEH